VTAEFFSSLTWTFLDDAFTRRRVDPLLAGDRIDPRYASGRLRAASCWSSPRVAYLQIWPPCGRRSSAASPPAACGAERLVRCMERDHDRAAPYLDGKMAIVRYVTKEEVR
jgi:hypothetical protein